METRVLKTIERHDKGYNCAQAVACTYCDLVGIDEETMFRITEGFGAGMGNMEGTCGAVSGACALAGLEAQHRKSVSTGQQGKDLSAFKSDPESIQGTEQYGSL